MPLKTFVDGQSPSATEFNRYFMQQIYIRKTSNESVTSSITQQPDNELFCAVEANTDYFVNMLVIYEATLAGDLRSSFTGPAGATFDYVSDCIHSTGTATVDKLSRTHQVLTTSLPTSGGVGAGTSVGALFKGLLRISSTAGTLQYLWSQNTLDATSTIVKSGSIMMLRRLTD